MREFFSTSGVFKTRNLVIMALMAALTFVLSSFTIAIGPTFKLLDISYLPGTVVACLFGPWAALVFGFAADTVGYIARPLGPYFPGYAISAMIVNFIYAALFYRQKITVVRTVIARLLHTVVVILGINFLWNVMMYGAAASVFYTGQRLLNNLIQIPIHVALTMLFCRFARMLEAKGAVSR